MTNYSTWINDDDDKPGFLNKSNDLTSLSSIYTRRCTGVRSFFFLHVYMPFIRCIHLLC